MKYTLVLVLVLVLFSKSDKWNSYTDIRLWRLDFQNQKQETNMMYISIGISIALLYGNLKC